MIPDRPGRTDGQTDGRLTVASPRSALASRGKNTSSILFIGRHYGIALCRRKGI